MVWLTPLPWAMGIVVAGTPSTTTTVVATTPLKVRLMTPSDLDRICNDVDRVLAYYELYAMVSGGYLVGNGLLLTLSQAISIDANVQSFMSETLGGCEIKATVGIILIGNMDMIRAIIEDDIVEGEIFEIKEMCIMDLIEVHERIAK